MTPHHDAELQQVELVVGEPPAGGTEVVHGPGAMEGAVGLAERQEVPFPPEILG